MANLAVEEVVDRRAEGVAGAAQPKELSRDLKPAEAGTDRAALPAIAGTEQPHPADRIEPKTITDAPPAAEKVAEAAAKAGVSDPHPGLEGIKAALLYERNAVKQLRGTEEETSKHLQAIDQLLDLSADLAALPEKEKHEISDKMQEILKQLKEKGIDLLKGDSKQITKEQLIELKSAIGSHVDKSRTIVQQIFTKMQNIIQNMMSVNDSGKRIISEFTQLLRTISKNMRPG